jgi:hypothetical protein
MRMRITLLALAALALAAPASAQQLFDYNGQADVPAVVGDVLTMHSVVFDPAPGVTPIPLDFGSYEYTLVVTGLTLDSVSGIQSSYSGGVIAIYEDDATPADFADQGTFTDGAAILTGTFTALTRSMFTASLGSVDGFVNWTGGSRLNDIAPEDQDQWAFLSGVNVNFAEAGYDEEWDGKVEPSDIIVGSEIRSWGSVKALMR